MKCQFCRKKEGTEVIVDKETLKEVYICKECFKAINREAYM